MRISSLLLGLAAFASAHSFGPSSSLTATTDDHKVPGDSPLNLCKGEHADDIIQIQKVDLLPNPPEAGQKLLIKAVGSVSKTIEDGAYVLLEIKYGLIRLLRQKADLCEQIQNVDMECPINKGVVSITKTVELPKEIPPGKYTVFADVYSKDDKPITCLTATIVFGVRSAAKNFLNVEL